MSLLASLYRKALKPFLFTMDAETAHEFAVHSLTKAGKIPFSHQAIAALFRVKDARLEMSVRSLTCPNPIGLAAGFDKTAELVDVLPSFGFGFVETGTFTPLPQEGQARPRLFRYRKQQALVNRMGFNNPGVKIAEERLGRRDPAVRVPVGANVGKGRETPLEEATDDYLTAIRHVHDVADYLVMNLSSPNTPNLRQLQNAEPLERILKGASEIVRERAERDGKPPKPLFVKISPDAGPEQIEDICRLCVENNCGIVATNTTLDHSSLINGGRDQPGGLSGRPLRTKSNEVIRRVRRLTRGVVPIIGVGGIFSAADAYEKIRLGASLVQIYTGWIFQGPGLAAEINRGLLKLIEKDGLKAVRDAVGVDA